MERRQNVAATVVDGDGTPSLLLQGTVDICRAAELHQSALALLARGEDAVIDCHGADHLDASALQLFIALKDGLGIKGKNLRMEGVSAEIESVMRLAGLADLLQT